MLRLQKTKGQLTDYHNFGTQSASFHLHPRPAMASSNFLCLWTYSIVTMSSSGVRLGIPPSKARPKGHSTSSKGNQGSSRLTSITSPTVAIDKLKPAHLDRDQPFQIANHVAEEANLKSEVHNTMTVLGGSPLAAHIDSAEPSGMEPFKTSGTHVMYCVTNVMYCVICMCY